MRWGDIITEAFPKRQDWRLHDTSDLNTLEIERDGIWTPATRKEKQAIEAKADEVMAILDARRARRQKMKQAVGDLNHAQLYEILLDDEKLEQLKTRVREIEGG